MSTDAGPERAPAEVPPPARHDRAGDHTGDHTGDRTSTRRVVGWACAGVVAGRLVYAWQPLRSDEGGYLFIARHWDPGGEFLFGDYHVDRPPLLLAIYRLAALSEWDGMIRIVAIPFVLASVLALAHAARLLGGSTAERWAAVVAAALLSTPALAADQADGELFAVTFVSLSLASAARAWCAETTRRRAAYLLAAGVFGGAAPLVKQNFLDGLLFAVVLLVGALALRSTTRAYVVPAVAVLGAGALLPHGAVAVWAAAHGIAPTALWSDLLGFRGDALAVIGDGSLRAPATRAALLLGVAAVSGLLTALWVWGRLLRERPRGPVVWAVTAVLLFGTWAVLMGGSYWPHYALQLVPGVALAAGLGAATGGRAGGSLRRCGTGTVVSSVVAFALVTSVYATVPWVWYQERTGQWLAASSVGGDTVVVAYGQPSVLEAADLDTPYPYLWSLPMRTLDPDQARLRRTLAGDRAPTWVVVLDPLNSWDIDASGRLRAMVEDRYAEVAQVCGHPVLLRTDLTRTLAPLPRC